MSTFEGFETVKGMECVRIRSRIKGTAHGTGKLEGQTLKLTSGEPDDTTTMTWYFAYKKGIFVKSILESIGSMDISHGPVDVPLMMKVRTTVELVL